MDVALVRRALAFVGGAGRGVGDALASSCARMMAEASVAFVAIALLFSSAGSQACSGRKAARGCPRVGGTCCRCLLRATTRAPFLFPRGKRPNLKWSARVGAPGMQKTRGVGARASMATMVAIAAVGATSIVGEVEQLRPRCGAFVLNSRLVSSQHPISVCDATLADRGGTSSQKRRRTMEAGEEEAGYGAFLRAMPTAHTYLGEVRDLPGNSDIRYELARSGGPLRCNSIAPLSHQVLFPGDTLPPMIPSDDPLTQRLVHRAMAAPPPLKGLFCALTFVPEMYDVASEDPAASSAP